MLDSNRPAVKRKALIICTVVLLICLSLWLSSKRHNEVELPDQSVEPTAQSSQKGQPLVDDHAQMTSNSQLSPLPVSATPLAKAVAKTNPVATKGWAIWQAPIEFYGKVVDEKGNPVSEANATFMWTETLSAGGNKTSTTTSDTEGLFSLQNERGPSLEVLISKEGYYASHGGHWGFDYTSGPDIMSPNPRNPIIFLLHKKGAPEPLIHVAGTGLHTMRDFLLAADGEPTEISLRDGNLNSAGQADLRVEFQAGPPLSNFPSRISWQCRVTIPSGGLIQTDEEFPFLAPEDGYQLADQWRIDATNWTQEVDRQYYVKLQDGNFGRIKLRVKGVPDRAYFRMESFLNPSGSRNLEYDPTDAGQANQ
jgi:hypothetical protein